jgi:heterotetrameric sarcosine oxidase delta subunit
MLRIACPHCGTRDEVEFSYRGDATVRRPRDAAPEEEAEAFFRYVHARANPRGWHVEWWQHAAGCRQWLKVVRHTVTHEVAQVLTAGETPEVPAA